MPLDTGCSPPRSSVSADGRVCVMKTIDKYRFTLQWQSDTEEKIQVGEFLESLGNKKSEFIVAAVSEYLRNHPDIQTAGSKPRITIRPTITRERLEEMIQAMLAERLAGVVTAAGAETLPDGGTTDVESSAVAEMLGNLDFFT